MNHHRIRYFLSVTLLSIAITACQLSASNKPPTAFTFPTPDLTGTALTSSISTALAPTVSPMGAATATPPPLPSSTPVPAVTATSAPAAATSTSLPTATSTPAVTVVPLTRSVGKIVATYLQTPPDVDGDLSKWTLFQYPVDYVAYGASDWVDAQDLSAKVMVGWDTDNLYLGVHVLDSRYVQNATGANLFLGDSLEILLDTNLAVDFFVDSLSPDDFQLGISPGNPDPGKHPEAYLWFPTTIKGDNTYVKIAARAVDGGYDVEIAIPWSVFEVKPVAGQHYGFAVSVSDNDKRTDDVQQSMVSSVPNRHLTDPTTWGDLMLAQP